jgi:uncharacterized protein (DUF885 family)
VKNQRQTSDRKRLGRAGASLIAILALAACDRGSDGATSAKATGEPPLATLQIPTPLAPDGGAMKSTAPEDAAFTAFATRFLAEYLERSPVAATEAGEHRYDAKWPDVSVEGDKKDRIFYEGRLKELGGIPRDKLGEQNRVDHALLENILRGRLFALDELHEEETDPLVYTRLLGEGLDPLVTREFAPIGDRMRSLKGRLEGIPAVVAAAKARLKKPPKVFTETAIQQNQGLIALCEQGLAEHFAKVPGEKPALEVAAKAAAAALHDLQTFFEKELLPRSDADFRLGRARFEKKLRLSLDDEVDIDALAKSARALFDKVREEMAVTAKELWPTLFKDAKPPADKTALIQKVLEKVADDHPDNSSIVTDSKKLLEDATKFVKEHDLVRVPTEPCKVIEMPEYRRGVSIAYCDASGPLEKKPETFFAISPTPKDWPQKRAESFYREYNRSMLADLTVHEAMPGHFLQIMHNNTFRSQLRAVFGSGAFVEGWAVYGEWLMAKYGFGGPMVRLMQQKMQLRSCANAILDHDIHAGTMDEKAALDLMMKEAFQEEGEAVGKWKRARLSSAQLTTYFYGYTEMMKLREKAEKAPGFKERAYHDRLLSHGAPSMRALRGLMDH